MEEKFLISLNGTQFVKGKQDKLNLLALGHYIFSEDEIFISFFEYDHDDSTTKIETVITIDKTNRMIITKKGPTNSQLIIEKGVRHMGHYITDYGSLQVGTYTNKVETDFNENGGKVVAEYQIDINSAVTSYNKISITVQEAGKSNVRNS